MENLILKATRLKELTSETLEPIRNYVRQVSIVNNGAELLIEDDAFQNTHLDLLEVSQQSISQHGFLKSVSTRTLNLSGNRLLSTSFDVYPRLISVTVAILSDIGMEYLSEDQFVSLTGLSLLDLSHNKVFILDGDAFQKTPRLRTLILDYNPIIRISHGFGDNLRNLVTLSLRGGKLSEWIDPRPLSPMTSLRHLDIRDNLIQVRSGKAFLLFTNNGLLGECCTIVHGMLEASRAVCLGNGFNSAAMYTIVYASDPNKELYTLHTFYWPHLRRRNRSFVDAQVYINCQRGTGDEFIATSEESFSTQLAHMKDPTKLGAHFCLPYMGQYIYVHIYSVETLS